jgi:hypothetical protein
MKIRHIAILAACAFLTGACNKSPTSPTTNNSDSQPSPAPIQAEPFHGQVYKSLDGRNVLTLTSKEECELMQEGTTLLCKYTKQNDAVRVIATVMGTPQVIYYRFTDQGIQDNNGNVLLSPERYTAAIEQLQRQKQEELQRQQEIERKRREAEQAEKDEAVRIAKLIEDSKKPTKTLGEFHVRYNGSPNKLVVTDTGLEEYEEWGDRRVFYYYFVYYWSRYDPTYNYYQITQHSPDGGAYIQPTFVFANQAERDKFHDLYFTTMKKWAELNPEAFRQYEHKNIP